MTINEPEYQLEKSSKHEVLKVKTEIIPQKEIIEPTYRKNKTAELIGTFIKGFIQGCFEAITEIDTRDIKSSKHQQGKGKRRRSGQRRHKNR